MSVFGAPGGPQRVKLQRMKNTLVEQRSTCCLILIQSPSSCFSFHIFSSDPLLMSSQCLKNIISFRHIFFPYTFVPICLFLYVLCFVVYSLSRVQLFTTPWTVAHQARLFLGFSRQEYWSGLSTFLIFSRSFFF